MTRTPEIETARLVLRAPREEDFNAWADFCGDEEAMRHLGGPMPRGAAWRNIATVAGAWSLYGFGMFSVIEKASGLWVGRLGPWRPDGWPGTEIAWGLARPAWGRGYASEGARAALDWAFETLGWTEAIHTIDPANTPSHAVARRLGSRILRQAVLPPPLGWKVDVWGQSREDWARGRGG